MKGTIVLETRENKSLKSGGKRLKVLSPESAFLLRFAPARLRSHQQTIRRLLEVPLCNTARLFLAVFTAADCTRQLSVSLSVLRILTPIKYRAELEFTTLSVCSTIFSYPLFPAALSLHYGNLGGHHPQHLQESFRAISRAPGFFPQ